jgi:hypothetical protein
MTDEGVLLDRRAIEDAFRRLGDRLAHRGVVADLYIFGGAAMSMVYDSRQATRDIDAVFQPHGVVLEEARRSGGTRPASVVAERAGQRLHSPPEVTALPREFSTIQGCVCRPPRRSICWQ